MNTLAFLIVFSLLLGVVAGLMQPIHAHTEKLHQTKEEWGNADAENECAMKKNRAETHYAKIAVLNCALSEWFIGGNPHYE